MFQRKARHSVEATAVDISKMGYFNFSAFFLNTRNVKIPYTLRHVYGIPIPHHYHCKSVPAATVDSRFSNFNET
jgi:hypothetical protein